MKIPLNEVISAILVSALFTLFHLVLVMLAKSFTLSGNDIERLVICYSNSQTIKCKCFALDLLKITNQLVFFLASVH